MKQKTKCVLIKKGIYKNIESYDFNESFAMAKKKDDKRIGVIKFYDDILINKVIQKSIDNRFRKILELISDIDEGDGDPTDGFMICLDEVTRFKREMINKYSKFLKKSQTDFINKKLELLEKEIKEKLISYHVMESTLRKKMTDQEESIKEKTHGR